MNLSEYPFVSVIVPVHNNAAELDATLDALQEQSYPRERFEVIVVDNGSSDASLEIAEDGRANLVLREHNQLGSPYSARNRGIEVSEGEVLVFLDATCLPEHEWLSEGIRAMREAGADLVAGNVLFSFGTPRTAAELCDALTNIRMRESVMKGYAKTASLFVRREVIDEVGMFPEGLRSGGDVRWTARAVSTGKQLEFGERAVCYKPARRFRELMRKQWRVAFHQPAVWQERDGTIGFVRAVGMIVWPLVPPSLRVLEQRADTDGVRWTMRELVQAWLVTWAVKWVMGLGRIYGLISKRGWGDSPRT